MPSHLETCTTNCPGLNNDGLGACCTVGDRNYIIGPILDAADVISRIDYSYEEVFIDFAEGSALYPERSSWQAEEAYPALRLVNGSCMFYVDNMCSIHENKPLACKQFTCPAVREALSIQTDSTDFIVLIED